jgi:BASS family bile acid:Na+ symporter
LLFGWWGSMNPVTIELLHDIEISVGRVIGVLMIMVVAPVTMGMLIAAKRPTAASKLKRWVRRLSMLVFGTVVVVVLGQNARLLLDYASEALAPVLVTFAIAVVLGWTLAFGARLQSAERRAVTLEVAMQNVGLAIGTAVAFFPSLAGVAVTAALWGVVHLTCGFALAAFWARA